MNNKVNDTIRWTFADDVNRFGLSTGRKVRKQDLRVGLEITDGYCDWIITDVLGDGKFKAVPEEVVTDTYGPQAPITEEDKETFALSNRRS
jgi:hypothetical protein